MGKDIKEAKLELFVVAYPHEEDDLYNVRMEGRLGDEVVFDIPIDRGIDAEYIFEQIKRNLEA